MQKVMIGWPNAGSTLSVFTKSLVDLVQWEAAHPSDDYEIVAVDHVASVYVQDNRNDLVEKAKAIGADWLLQLDDDQQFQPELLRLLMRESDSITRPIVTGVYANVSTNPDGSFCVVDHIFGEVESGAYRPVQPPDDLQPFQVDAAGTGIFLTHLSIYDRMDFPWFWLDKIQLASGRIQTINEDLGFCRKAREAGYPIWCVPLAETIHWKRLPLTTSLVRRWVGRVGDIAQEMRGAINGNRNAFTR